MHLQLGNLIISLTPLPGGGRGSRKGGEREEEGGGGGEGSGREGGGRQARLSEDLASWDPFPQRSSLPRLLVGQRALMQEV